MPGNRKFTRIPPESTGDRIRVSAHTNIFYTGKVDDISPGNQLLLATSGLTGTIARVREDTVSTGMISVNWSEISDDNDATTPVTGENITLAPASGGAYVTVATVATSTPFDTYTNVNTLVSYDNHYRGQKVSPQGEAYVRFGDGAARVGADGKLEVETANVLAEYPFTYTALSEEFADLSAGSATVTHENTSGALLLTTTTGATDLAKYRSHLYHHYVPGVPVIAEQTVVLSDTGKANQTSRWGMFDDNDGLFYEVVNGVISLVRRTSTSGSAVETQILRDDWNGDQLTGMGDQTNPSGVLLDLTKLNVWWIDYTWHGAGIARFGIFAGGQRITCHTESFANTDTVAYMRRASLPISWEIENTGVTASTSEMRCWSASVAIGGPTEPLQEAKTWTNSSAGPIILSGATETAFFSYRPKAIFNGIENHCVAAAQRFNAMAYDSVTGDNGRVRIRAYVAATLAAPTWTSKGDESCLEIDTVGTLSSPGILISEFYLYGDRTWDFADIITIAYRNVIRRADGTIPEYTFTAQREFGTNDMAFDFQIRWKEIIG